MPDDSQPEMVDPNAQPSASPGMTPSGGRRGSGSKPANAWEPPTPQELEHQIPQYRVLDLVGRGGMGAVYKGVQVSLERHVAIKILPPEFDDDDAQFANRFKREARTMAKLRHPGIVSVYDAGETDSGLLYIVMEFIEGTDVAQMVKSQGRLSADYALAITAHVCDALQYAHSHGVMHRDIKPANIMLNMEGAVKVADFGLAKATEHGQGGGLTRTNVAMGTPDYIAPEALITGIDVDHRADLYAIGVMLYNMLTGQIPRGAFRPASQKAGSDPRFDAIIMKAMEPEREARYQSAQEIRRDLDAILTAPRAKESQLSPPLARKPVARGPGKDTNAAVAKSGDMPHGKARPDIKSAPGPTSRPGGAVVRRKSGAAMVTGIVGAVAIIGIIAFPAFKKPKPAPDRAAPIQDHQAEVASVSTASSRAATPAAPANSGAVLTFARHRYQLVMEKLKWPEAKAKAQSMGGHLATITSREENDWIYGQITSRLKRTKTDANADRCFIGVSKKIGPNAPWELVTGQPLSLQPWMGNFPDDRDPGPKVGTLQGRRWDDVNTNFPPLAFLVEWDDDGDESKPTASTATPGGVDLLARVDVERDAVKGDWERTPEGLAATKAIGAQLLGFNHAPPEEYDFEIEFTLKEGMKEVSQVLPVPGGSILWKMGVGGGGSVVPFLFGPELDGNNSQKDPARTEAIIRRPRLNINQRYRSLVEVRKGSLRALIDGSEVLAWSGDLKRLSNEPTFKLPNKAHPGVASYGTSIVFHKAELRPPGT